MSTEDSTTKKPVNSLSYISSLNGGIAFNCDVCQGNTVEEILANGRQEGANVVNAVGASVGNLTTNLANKFSNLGTNIDNAVQKALEAVGL